jgi:hypothetical protein
MFENLRCGMGVKRIRLHPLAAQGVQLVDIGQQGRFLDLILYSTDRLIHLVDGMAGAEAT